MHVIIFFFQVENEHCTHAVREANLCQCVIFFKHQHQRVGGGCGAVHVRPGGSNPGVEGVSESGCLYGCCDHSLWEEFRISLLLSFPRRLFARRLPPPLLNYFHHGGSFLTFVSLPLLPTGYTGEDALIRHMTDGKGEHCWRDQCQNSLHQEFIRSILILTTITMFSAAKLSVLRMLIFVFSKSIIYFWMCFYNAQFNTST